MKNKDYMLTWCTDFHDELVYAWFNEKRLKRLFSLLKSWGMKRVYWIDLFKWSEGKFDMSAYKRIRENARRTYENIGESLPAATKIAHELGLEFYSVFKPFDFGFPYSFPFNTPEAKKYGKLDCLSGKMYWALNSLVKLQNKRLKRHPADLPGGLKKKTISTIKLVATEPGQTTFGKEDLQLLISEDNGCYLPYKKDFSFRSVIENGNRTIYLEKLSIKSPFFAIKCTPPQPLGIFTNSLEQLITLYDSRGKIIPFTYGLTPRRRPGLEGAKGALQSPFKAALLEGFVFGNGGPTDQGLKNTSHTLDGPEKNIVAIAKGKEPFIGGALSPAWPETRKLWLSQIRFALEAGVDGVDLRAANHNRSFEWERYGFESPVVKEYKKRFRIDITKEDFSIAKHRQILGEFYTQFLEQASGLIHSFNRKAQVHVLGAQIQPVEGQHYMNFKWEWEKWLKKLDFDAVTIKNGPWFDQSIWDPIKKAAKPKNVSAFLCPYWKSVTTKSNWQKKLLETLEQSKKWGHAGFILYESAMTIKVDSKGKITLLDPDLPKILKKFKGE